MQSSTTFRTVSRRSVQLALLATVAAVGVSVGRWVVPDASGSVAGHGVVLGAQQAPLPEGRATLIERKFAQMDAQDASSLDGPAADLAALNSGGSLIESKFAQMDAEDAVSLDGPAADLPALSGAGSPIERKFAQMDAEDAR